MVTAVKDVFVRRANGYFRVFQGISGYFRVFQGISGYLGSEQKINRSFSIFFERKK
jgi:hypothetical protein